MEFVIITKPKRTLTPFTGKDSVLVSDTILLNRQEIPLNASIYLTGIRFCRVYQQEIRVQRQKRSNFSINNTIINSKTGSDNTILDVVSFPNIGHSRSAELAHLDELPYLFEIQITSIKDYATYGNTNDLKETLYPVVGISDNLSLNIKSIVANNSKFQTILVPSTCNLNYTRLGWFGCVAWDQKLQTLLGKFEDTIPNSLDVSFVIYDYKHLPLNLVPEVELKFTIM